MTFWLTLRIAMRALAANPMRSFLTVLGVVIGVAAVVAMVAIGEGAKARVEASFASMGTDMLILTSGSSRGGGARGGAGSQPTITWDDLNAIRTQVPGVRTAAVQLRANGTVASEEQNWTTTIYGTGPELFEVRRWAAESGQLLTTADVETRGKVVVLGKTVVTELWGEGANPLGETIRINKHPFVVAGILTAKGQSAMGQDYDDAVYIPHTSFAGKISRGLSQFINGQVMIAASNGDTAAVQPKVTALLRERHALSADQEDDFSLRDLAEMANASQEGANTMSLLLSGIAAVSLLVGGIGIMNIMLVSVTERTREIGLRMALGAKPNNVLAQFLVEAVVLSVIGGAIGVAAGIGIATYLASAFGWSVAVRADVVALALGFSVFVGVVFGLYPARRASQLTPIDALRAE